jgi:hypothetical protein
MLQPCAQCNRHIVETERACPFCGAPNEARPRAVPLLEGRLSRAAVFASSVLVAPACVVNDPPPPQYPHYQQPPPNYQQPPPPDYQQQQPPPQDPNYAQPPPPDDTQTYNPPPPPDPAPPPAAVHLVVRWSDGRPYVGPVQLHSNTSRSEQTNAYGELVVRDLPPGQYTITVPSNHPRRAPAQAVVQLRSNTIERVNLVTDIQAPVYERHNSPKPYGAPPARKRVV